MMLRFELSMLGQQPRMFGVEVLAHRFTVRLAAASTARVLWQRAAERHRSIVEELSGIVTRGRDEAVA